MPIERRQIAPKTWELYNTEPAGGIAPTGDVAAQMFEQTQQADPGYVPTSSAQAAQRRAWRKQFMQFDQAIKKGGSPIEGIQGLIDSGGLFMTNEGDVYSTVQGHGKRQTERLLQAAQQWNSYQQRLIDSGVDVPPLPGRDQLIDWQRSRGLTPSDAKTP